MGGLHLSTVCKELGVPGATHNLPLAPTQLQFPGDIPLFLMHTVNPSQCWTFSVTKENQMRKFSVLVKNCEVAQQYPKTQTVSQRVMPLSHPELCCHLQPLPISWEFFAGARKKSPPVKVGPWPGVFCKHQQMELKGPNSAQRANYCWWKQAQEPGKSKGLMHEQNEPQNCCLFWLISG